MAKRPVTTADVLDGARVLGPGMSGLDLSERLCAEPAGRWPGRAVLGIAGVPDSISDGGGRSGDQFRRSVRPFAEANQIPMVKFGKGERKIEAMKPYLRSGEVGPVRGGGDRVGTGVPTSRDLHDPRGPHRWGAAFRLGPGRHAVTCYYFDDWYNQFGPVAPYHEARLADLIEHAEDLDRYRAGEVRRLARIPNDPSLTLGRPRALEVLLVGRAAPRISRSSPACSNR
jgi:hypothetical protein